MGFTCKLSPLGTITYRAELDGGMVEHELVHVFRGFYDGAVTPDPAEAEDYRWLSLADVRADMTSGPERYSVWLREYLSAQWPLASA
jgi:isopentenyl-diphosphate delta-isomerase